MISGLPDQDTFAQGVKKTAHSINESREPKSEAKLLPLRKTAKYLTEKIRKITLFNR